MLRSRAIKLPEVTESMWEQVDEEHRNLVQEFLDAHSFRDKTRKQYYSSFANSFGGYIPLLTGKNFIRSQSVISLGIKVS